MSRQARDVPCGIYRTTRSIGKEVPSGALVFYHNHGDPGPGVYLPREWRHNRAVFEERGTTIPGPGYARTLVPLREEGLYRVGVPFYCCEKKCEHFEKDLLVQLGYDADAQAILFVPRLVDGDLVFPDEGTVVEDWQLDALRPLKVPEADTDEDEGEDEDAEDDGTDPEDEHLLLN